MLIKKKSGIHSQFQVKTFKSLTMQNVVQNQICFLVFFSFLFYNIGVTYPNIDCQINTLITCNLGDLVLSI